jgi:hypothetical protein
VEDLFAIDEHIHDLAQGSALAEEIFTGLYFRTAAFKDEGYIEKQRTINDIFPVELGDDLGKISARRDIEHLIGRQGPRRVQSLLAGD